MMARSVRTALGTALGLVLFAAPAQAGRTHFGWLYDTETLPQRGVELETWIQEENLPGDESTLFWWAPIVGITDRFELAVPVAFKLGVTATGTHFGFDRFGAEVRAKVTNPDPVEAGPFGFLIRFGAFRQGEKRGMARLELGLIPSVTIGRVHITLDAEGNVKVGDQPFEAELEPGLGVSVRIVDELRLGVEAQASIHLTDNARWVAVGPNLAWTHGRFWLSASFLIGVYGITTAPRINFAIAF
jgi:hypothetical protein